MPTRVIAFDVNETLLDLRPIDPEPDITGADLGKVADRMLAM